MNKYEALMLHNNDILSSVLHLFYFKTREGRNENTEDKHSGIKMSKFCEDQLSFSCMCKTGRL